MEVYILCGTFPLQFLLKNERYQPSTSMQSLVQCRALFVHNNEDLKILPILEDSENVPDTSYHLPNLLYKIVKALKFGRDKDWQTN